MLIFQLESFKIGLILFWNPLLTVTLPPHSLVPTYPLLNCSKYGTSKFFDACGRGDIETVRKWIAVVKNYQVILVEIVMISMLMLIYT